MSYVLAATAPVRVVGNERSRRGGLACMLYGGQLHAMRTLSLSWSCSLLQCKKKETKVAGELLIADAVNIPPDIGFLSLTGAVTSTRTATLSFLPFLPSESTNNLSMS